MLASDITTLISDLGLMWLFNVDSSLPLRPLNVKLLGFFVSFLVSIIIFFFNSVQVSQLEYVFSRRAHSVCPLCDAAHLGIALQPDPAS